MHEKPGMNIFPKWCNVMYAMQLLGAWHTLHHLGQAAPNKNRTSVLIHEDKADEGHLSKQLLAFPLPF